MSDKRIYKGRKGSRGSLSYERRPSISRRRPLNRFELESPQPESVTVSAKKLRLFTDSYDVQMDEGFGYRILAFAAVFSAISEAVVCKTCKSKVKFTEAGKRGLGFKIVISCENCESVYIPSGPFVNKGFEINRRIILVMRLLGIGINGIEKFCAFMDLPHPIFHSFYDQVVRTIAAATKLVSELSMKKAAEEEKAECISHNENDGLIVSSDGTWRKRGFSSLFGLVSLIGWFTGKVLDIEVKSKYSKSCEYWKKKDDTAENAECLESHADECEVNHEGSAGKMEVNAVIEMFQRSMTLHFVKYAHYVGDKDSKTFRDLLDAQPYENFTVSKKECIDHIQKRMGTHLRNLKKNITGLEEKLTDELIDELEIYYGLAIRRNPNSIEKMRNDIWATLHHKISTDEKPQHDKCPEDEDSWCSWQKAKATGTLHEHKHKSALPQDIYKVLTPIYEELSRDDLLKRCISSYTQNNNENFNSIVWSLAPKSVSSDADKVILDIAVTIATCVYNDGLTSIMKIMELLGITIGSNCYNFCQKIEPYQAFEAITD